MAGQKRDVPGPTFQQHPPTTAALPPPPPPYRPGPFSQQQSIYQQRHLSFHPTAGASPYQHALPSFPHQGPPGSVASCGLISAQVSQTSEHEPWSQYAHQLPLNATHPGPKVYPMHFPQGHTLERGQSNQLPSQARLPMPPPLLHYPYGSGSLVSDPFGFSGNLKNSYPQSVGPLPPPPSLPPPPPPPPSPPPSPPPPPPSSPPPDVPYKNGNHSTKDLPDSDNLMMKNPSQVESIEDKSLRQNEVPCQNTENAGSKMESMDVVVAHSGTSSDMEMEDDITHPEEIKNCLATNLVGDSTSVSQEDFVKEQVQASEHTGEHRVPEDAVNENLLFAELTVLKDQRGGASAVVSLAEADESGVGKYGQTEQALEDRVCESSSQHKVSDRSCVPVVCEESNNMKLSVQLVEGANSFNRFQEHTPDNYPKTEDENFLKGVTSPAHKVGPTNSDTREGHKFVAKCEVDSLSEPNQPTLLKSVIELPRNVMEVDKISYPTGILELSDKSYGGQEPFTNTAALESESRLRSSDASISPAGANIYKRGKQSNCTESKVDEFGRLLRDGASDSDTSGSPHYSRRYTRRARRSSSSRSRSRSPHDKRRRRSPSRRKGRRDPYVSVSPRRRSRSRSPLSRREKATQLPEKCFDFVRGRCYRGATCRFSHSEAYNKERLRSSMDTHFHVRQANVSQGVSRSREDKDAKEIPVESNTHSRDKLNNLVTCSLSVEVVASNLPGYSSHDLPSRNPESLEIQGKIIGDSLVSDFSPLVQASATHILADIPDAKKAPINQQLCSENPLIKTCLTEEVKSESSKELPASVPSMSTLPFPSVSQMMSAPFGQNHNLMQPIVQFPSTMGSQTSYKAPVANQHPHFPGSSNLFLPPPPPLPPPPLHFSAHTSFGENGNPPRHIQQPLQSPWNGMSYASTMTQATDLPDRTQTNHYQTYALPRENNLSSLPGGRVTGERPTRFPMQDMNLPQSFPQAQPYSLMTNRPIYAHNFASSGMSSYFNSFTSTFDMLPGSKLESNASVHENVTANYGAPVGSSSVPVGASVVSKNMVPTSHMPPDHNVLSRSGGDQYDPLFDSIEPAPTLFNRAGFKTSETPGGSDNRPIFAESERVFNMEIIKPEGCTVLSANDFVENEEFGETADVEVGDVLNERFSSPNDRTNMNAGEVEIDQVETVKKKAKGKDSMKLFKISIASFVKEILKPSWRQGNMSKEAFKTIVKKTVDKVSGAMKGHRVPKSKANIDDYIDSSRGKLTKLVMGYVDKYVKV